ncbi:Monomeric sarcosine oxidase [Methylobacterium tardum]|uniref:Sarcosine oxidase n=1 Tax=Methylobacterium tardum TaxID=374432 RepID=A0AA37WVM4_9HYPH|nr:N-methyl-L-tryptophan oxidase [Methylobacterium tardum]URD35826.1 N-methyl-L-tryptophan oxidase [Methylobacterium tardum]GJE51831.1 Monomeric sarcosine oxidase [Methylobacterium tardum]GLS72313.1 sarcosine oxidase [Methylobacterium tardum]
MTRRVDVAVLGLGAMGSAVLYQLAKSGAAVVGIDRFAPPHAFGSSHGETRITRQAVGEGRDYVPFVGASHRIWRELEAATGETLLNACGALVMAPGHGISSHHGKPDFVGRSISAAQGAGIAHEVLDGAEVARRFPQFLNLAGDEKAYYEPGGGYVFPERCLAAQLGCAAAAGAEIRTGCAVRALSQDGAGIRIETEDGGILADRAVVAAGAWTAPLLGSPFDRLLTVRRQLLHWYALTDDSAYGPQAPVFIWMYGTTDTEYLYGFPPLPGERAIKVATEQYDTATTADGVERRVDPSESAEMYRLRVADRLAGATPEVVRAAACVYTVTPDRGFIIDRHPRMDRLWVVSACSGHGFKHSAGIGEAVAAELAGGPGRVDLAPFALARFG